MGRTKLGEPFLYSLRSTRACRSIWVKMKAGGHSGGVETAPQFLKPTRRSLSRLPPILTLIAAHHSAIAMPQEIYLRCSVGHLGDEIAEYELTAKSRSSSNRSEDASRATADLG